MDVEVKLTDDGRTHIPVIGEVVNFGDRSVRVDSYDREFTPGMPVSVTLHCSEVIKRDGA